VTLGVLHVAQNARGRSRTAVAVLARGRERLRAAGCDTPELDAELLLADALGVDRASLVADLRRVLSEPEARSFEQHLARRVHREPVAYILGRRGFRFLELAVDSRVLVPRPETELLVEAALELRPGARVVDVGTGSGAVALALKQERPDLDVTGTDISAAGLAVARHNARRLGLEVAFRQADLLDGADGSWDAVVANLPYVAERDLDGLEPEISRHEPRMALAGGDDGLDLLRRLAQQAAGIPWVALEVGAGQAAAVAGLLRALGAAKVEVRRDLAGIERVVLARF
jgi:release factor glutamine methyltransferase